MKSFVNLVRNSRKFSLAYRSDPYASRIRTDDEIPYKLDLPTGTHTIYLRTSRGDINMFYELFWQKVYALELPLNDKPVIVDAGAHIGMASLFFLENYESAMVYSIEPDTANLALLRKNLSAEIAGRRVTVIGCALSGNEGAGLLDHSGWSYNSRLRHMDPVLQEGNHPLPANRSFMQQGSGQETIASVYSESEMVPIKTMENIIRENNIEHIDLLKIDIEGGEGSLFTNGTEWLNRVDNLVIEIHSDDLRNLIQPILKQNGFSFEKWNRNPHGDVYLARKTDPDA